MTTGFPVLTLAGSARDRGVQYGRGASDRIRNGLEFYRGVLTHAGVAALRLHELTNALAAEIERFDADMLHELEGIAFGAGVSLSEVISLNARSELLRLADEGCTGIACLPSATARGHTLLAQNWDWHPSRGSAAVLLRILPDDGPAMLAFAEAGALARCGLNEHGLGVVGNALECEGRTRREGIPVALIRRRLLGCRTVAEAVAAVRDTARGTSVNHLIASAEGVAVACEATAAAVYEVEPEAALLGHGNHFRSPQAQAELTDTGIARTPDTIARTARIRSLLSGREAIRVRDIGQALRDHDGYPNSICRHATEINARTWTTVASVIMDLDTRRMWLAAGPPCRNGHAEYLLEAGSTEAATRAPN